MTADDRPRHITFALSDWLRAHSDLPGSTRRELFERLPVEEQDAAWDELGECVRADQEQLELSFEPALDPAGEKDSQTATPAEVAADRSSPAKRLSRNELARGGDVLRKAPAREGYRDLGRQ
jgi:hypothetical protein